MTLFTRRHGLVLAGGAAFTLAAPTLIRAQTGTVHEVEMLNRNEETGDVMVFAPDIVRAEVGDTIRFLATDRGHNSVTVDEMLPEGAEGWRGRINEEIEVVLETPGAYGYICQPHVSMGMAGLVLVGDVSGNYEALKDVTQRGRAAQRWEDIFARADELLASEA